MIGPAKIYFIVFGVLTIAGGVMGYAKAGSTASIIAGSICGILLLLRPICSRTIWPRVLHSPRLSQSRWPAGSFRLSLRQDMSCRRG
jgi:hypothetical protein